MGARSPDTQAGDHLALPCQLNDHLLTTLTSIGVFLYPSDVQAAEHGAWPGNGCELTQGYGIAYRIATGMDDELPTRPSLASSSLIP